MRIRRRRVSFTRQVKRLGTCVGSSQMAELLGTQGEERRRHLQGLEVMCMNMPVSGMVTKSACQS